tara:strand:+ start:10307 stop:10540 length:234 start_codon:yes stop_codon:yes gene_type:complete
MKSTKGIIEKTKKNIPKTINQGDCVYLKNKEKLFQVLGVDNSYKKCWVREWPLTTNGSPVFEISLQQVSESQVNTQI